MLLTVKNIYFVQDRREIFSGKNIFFDEFLKRHTYSNVSRPNMTAICPMVNLRWTDMPGCAIAIFTGRIVVFSSVYYIGQFSGQMLMLNVWLYLWFGHYSA